jgi:methylenetetrahydrofolate--tRNA-(uracil-5-)-methyltransferase
MRPVKPTPATKQMRWLKSFAATPSNPIRRQRSWLLKEELKILDSPAHSLAYAHRVPSGASLSVDREHFAAAVTRSRKRINIDILREELQSIPQDAVAIIATGPLTSDSLSNPSGNSFGEEHLLYDAISPILDAESIDMGKDTRLRVTTKASPASHQLSLHQEIAWLSTMR